MCVHWIRIANIWILDDTNKFPVNCNLTSNNTNGNFMFTFVHGVQKKGHEDESWGSATGW